MDTATQHLIKHGIRPSVQRVAIMDYLLTHRTHPTVDAIYRDLLEEVPTLSRTTVYNTLELLAQNSAALALTIDSRNVHYDGCTVPHAHFLCRHCGHIADLPLESSLRRPSQLPAGCKVEDVQLNYIGICEDCSRKLKAQAKAQQN